MNYFEFTNEIRGFMFFDKKSNNQVYTWQLFVRKLTAEQCFKKYNTSVRITSEYF